MVSAKVFEGRYSFGKKKKNGPKTKVCSTGSIFGKSSQKTGLRDRE